MSGTSFRAKRRPNNSFKPTPLHDIVLPFGFRLLSLRLHHVAARLNSGVRFVMQRLPRLLLGLIALVASSCATTPPPSKFDGAQWWNGRGFDSEPRYVANGKFHHPPQNISETIPLPGLFAIPLSSADCDQHPVTVTTPFPRERLLVPGSVADFYLSKVDPRLSTPVAVAILCGGRLVK